MIGLDLLKIVREPGRRMPLIIFTGRGWEDVVFYSPTSRMKDILPDIEFTEIPGNATGNLG